MEAILSAGIWRGAYQHGHQEDEREWRESALHMEGALQGKTLRFLYLPVLLVALEDLKIVSKGIRIRKQMYVGVYTLFSKGYQYDWQQILSKEGKVSKA